MEDRVRFSEWPPRDSSGAIEFHRHNGITSFRALPWMIRAFDLVVPPEFWHRYVDPERDEPIAVIECGCGVCPWVSGAKIIECDCHRFFIFIGDQVRCYRPGDEAIAALLELDDGTES